MNSYEDKEEIYDASLYLLELDRLSISVSEKEEETLDYLLSSEDPSKLKARLANKKSKKRDKVKGIISNFENGKCLEDLTDEVIALSMISDNNKPGKFVYLSTLILESAGYDRKDVLDKITSRFDISMISKYSDNVNRLEEDYSNFVDGYLTESLRDRLFAES